jgi:WD40 repeat protein
LGENWQAAVLLSRHAEGAYVPLTASSSFLGLWDPSTGKKLSALEGHSEVVFGIAFSPDGTRLLSTSVDGWPRIWDVVTGRCLFVLEDVPVNPDGPSIAWSPDGSKIIGAVHNWMVEWELTPSWERHRLRIASRREQ